MKTNPMLLGVLASLAALTAAVATEAPVKSDARVEVTYAAPEKFTDVRDAYTASEMGRTGILNQIRDYLASQADKYVAPGQKLTVTFTDIDLAGDFEPWRGAEGMDVRIVKDIYPPKMDLEFKLTGADGTVIKEGKRQLRDLAFMSKLSINRSDMLRFEKALLDDWLKSDLTPAKSG